MKSCLITCCLLLTSLWVSAQSEFADVVLDAFYSGANPDFSTFYGNNGTTDGCKLFETTPEVALGDSDFVIALPTGSYITLGFTDNLIFDAVGQDDLFIEENGGGQEFGELYVSPDGNNFTFLDTINGAEINSYDLADYAYDDVVKAVKIVGLDEGGCVVGLDIARVYGVSGANCPCGADLLDFPDDVCALDTIVNLDRLVNDSIKGIWQGLGVYDDIYFNPQGLDSVLELVYLVNVNHPVCPVDTIPYLVELAYCDCNQKLDGPALIDQCGDCLDRTDPLFDMGCLDCAGQPQGTAIVDSCGLCLKITDPLFNASCRDCAGEPNGLSVYDLCGQCLELEDPLYNTQCDELFSTYMPDVFNPNGLGQDKVFGLMYAVDNVGFIEVFEIYDKWGNQVFGLENQPVKEVAQWWDGRWNGRELMTGLYTYHYLVSYPDIGDEVASGTVLLIR